MKNANSWPTFHLLNQKIWGCGPAALVSNAHWSSRTTVIRQTINIWDGCLDISDFSGGHFYGISLWTGWLIQWEKQLKVRLIKLPLGNVKLERRISEWDEFRNGMVLQRKSPNISSLRVGLFLSYWGHNFSFRSLIESHEFLIHSLF